MDVLKVEINHAGYSGNQDAVKDIHFTLAGGNLVGLIGPNGAGKSTTIKSIVNLLPDVAGDIRFIGENKTCAYIPEQPVLYDELTLWEHLELAAAAYEMDRQYFVKRSEELLALFHLSGVKHHFPGSFSKGMQQKLMIIIGLLIQPEVYIIDEPFVGLDPRATMQFINLLEKEKTHGAGILISTHQLDIAERICDSIILIADGKLVAQGNLSQIREKCLLPNASLFDCFNAILENES
ncbi:ABC transporter ATP-binding protein [Dehalobacterium formicoaceticum]|uniref:ABC transporter ATP-binding protein n=1 Tax=Dehalobacterium formicoaceticum TaxID=51515 RepID=A0ABT1Y1I3_9FIRM|nr:ABC transporter ATP-binding protein [Dehalobacterium formicoaceticum]MCR6544695.1 ABC transporter ATP-binding protein [Dehalobacterium formicoaceticum]